MNAAKLPKSYYLDSDTLHLAQDLIGKVLCTNIEGIFCSGMIVETEAYVGETDKACHAHIKRRTKRTSVMYAAGGIAYIYLCYGIHHLFNIITNREEEPHAVLVRAIEPLEGIEHMLIRRKQSLLSRRLTGGPGAMSAAMGISTALNRTDLTGDRIWIERECYQICKSQIMASPRVGIAYAEEFIDVPWRYRLMGSPWTSPAK